MEITVRWHRLLRALAFAGGLLLGLAMAVFIFSNLAPTELHWRIPANVGYSYDLTFRGVSLWVLAIVPLILGAVVGYFYQTPARMHHVREALRHRHRVHELEHELKTVRSSLDKLLMMPEDGRTAILAQIMAPIEHRTAEVEDEVERDPRLPDEPDAVEVLAAKPVKEQAKAPEAEAPSPARAAKPRRRFLGGLQAKVADIKLPAAIPATVVARPRRDGRAANGTAQPQAKPAVMAAAKPGRTRGPKRPS